MHLAVDLQDGQLPAERPGTGACAPGRAGKPAARYDNFLYVLKKLHILVADYRKDLMIKKQLLGDLPVASVIRTLIYYDVFNYPLSEDEIMGNSALLPDETSRLKQILDMLTREGVIYRVNGYYSLSDDPDRVRHRLQGNRKAVKWMKKAKWFSGLISSFPFVRGVSVSGSLSKGFLGRDPDIDYFIITSPNRLWLARTLLVAFKKIFLLNSYRYFCVNYFIDTDNLEIEEKNLFTATEIVTMIPMYGNGIKEDFFSSNRWIESYYPNYTMRQLDDLRSADAGGIKWALECLLNNRFGDWLDTRFMKMTVDHWHKKFRDRYTEEEFRLVFKSGRRISKHHPGNFQKKVMEEFNRRKVMLEKQKGLDLGNVSFHVEGSR